MPPFIRKTPDRLAVSEADERPAHPNTSSAASRLAAIQASIAELDRERAGHREALAMFVEREQSLLERDAPDEDLVRLDVQRRRSQHAVAQLNEREQALLGALAAAELEVRQSAFGEALDGYEAIALEVGALAAQLRQKLQALGSLSNDISGLTRAWQTDIYLPGNIQGINWEALDAPMQAVRTARRAPVSPSPAMILHAVRFVKFWESAPGSSIGPGYSAGVEAGFPAKLAWQLVDGGHAVWPDPMRIPSRPSAKREVAA